MKICAYCTAQNRDEAIFCARCKRPLPATPTRKDSSARQILSWLLAVFLLIGFSVYLLSSRGVFGPAMTQTGTSISMLTLTAGPLPTRTQEPVTPGACVENRTVRIRRGPGTQYETIGGLVAGTCLTILGRNEESSWVYIVSDDHQSGWVAASLLNGTGNLSRVSIRDHAIAANPARPTLTSAEIAHGAQLYLTEVAATNSPLSAPSRHAVPCFATIDRVGDHISCKLEKAYCDYLSDNEGNLTSCNDRPYPDHTFTLIVPGKDWSDYDGQCLIVSGLLEVNRGALQIQALNRSQISSCG
jgi:SH3-like domain-containing protein